MGTLYLGVDLHVRTQTVCWMNTADGEEHQRVLDHQRDDVRRFYAQLPPPAIVGVESCGYAVWFHQLVEETGHQLRVGDARLIRQFAKRRQKNDRRDAALLLALLRSGDFPTVHRPSGASREVLLLLRGRQRLVRLRTTLKNGLQALALSHQLRLDFGCGRKKGRRNLPGCSCREPTVSSASRCSWYCEPWRSRSYGPRRSCSGAPPAMCGWSACERIPASVC